MHEGKYFETTLDDNLQKLGFTKLSIFGKNISVCIQGRNPVISTYSKGEWERTAKSLEKKLVNEGIEQKSARELTVFLTQEFLKFASREAEQSSVNPNKETTRIVEEIEKDKSKVGEISSEEWQQTRKGKYDILYRTVSENIPAIWLPLEFTLSIKSILNIADITLPFAGIILGAPSTHKTVSLTMLNIWPQTFYTDSFTSRSLVSHSTAVTKEELREIDMLPRWKNKLVLLAELAPIFTAKDDDLTQLLGILTRVLDGNGYESDSGAHGHRGYREKIMFTLVGASVDIPYKVYKVLGYLGPKLYFLRLPKEEMSEDQRLKQSREDFAEKQQKIQLALFDYLKWLQIRPHVQVDKESSLPKIKWDYSNDDEMTERYIIRLAKLLAHLRGVAVTWKKEDTQGSDYGYTRPIVEDPSRAVTQLKNLARGHALFQGRNYLRKEDIPIVIKTVLSTASVERVSVFDMLLTSNGRLTTTEITGTLNISPPTARRTMTELSNLELVDMTDEDEGEKEIQLKPEFEWFLSKEFKKLREDFVPTDNTEEMKGTLITYLAERKITPYSHTSSFITSSERSD
jgi:hypothetical protein